MPNPIVSCNYKNKLGHLYGRAGGQLEYVSQRLEWRQEGNRYYQVVVMRFTDHDHSLPLFQSSSEMIDGKYYEFEFELAGDP